MNPTTTALTFGIAAGFLAGALAGSINAGAEQATCILTAQPQDERSYHLAYTDHNGMHILINRQDSTPLKPTDFESPADFDTVLWATKRGVIDNPDSFYDHLQNAGDCTFTEPYHAAPGWRPSIVIRAGYTPAPTTSTTVDTTTSTVPTTSSSTPPSSTSTTPPPPSTSPTDSTSPEPTAPPRTTWADPTPFPDVPPTVDIPTTSTPDLVTATVPPTDTVTTAPEPTTPPTAPGPTTPYITELPNTGGNIKGIATLGAIVTLLGVLWVRLARYERTTSKENQP